MPKKGHGKRRVRLIKGQVDESIALSTLVANTGILGATDTVSERAFLLSTEMVFAVREQTVGQGPLRLYWAHSDYSLAEIEEFIELQTGWKEADQVGQEVARRKIRLIGEFEGATADEVLNEGRIIKTPIKFIVNTGQGLNLVVYNDSGGTLAGGAIVEFKGHCWIKPQ